MEQKQFDVSTDGDRILLRMDYSVHSIKSVTAIALRKELYNAIADVKQNKKLKEI